MKTGFSKSMFSRIFMALMIAFSIFILLISIIIIIGYKTSVSNWSDQKQEEITVNLSRDIAASYKKYSRFVPNELRDITDKYLPGNIQLILLNSDRELVMVRRGRASGYVVRLQTGTMPADRVFFIRSDSETIGIMYMDKIDFQFDRANQQLEESLQISFFAAVISSVLIIFLVSFLLAKNLSRPAAEIARGIKKIARGEYQIRIREKGPEEIMQIARSVNDLGSQLQNEAEIRHQWTQDIAHDLRTPVAAVKSQIEGILDRVLPLDFKHMEKINREMLRIEKLVNDLGELTRLESPEIRLKKNSVGLDILFDSVLESFRIFISNKQLEIRKKIIFKKIRADNDLLFRVVQNIISNAVAYTPKKGLIRIKAIKKKNAVLVSVFNSGPGISMQEQEKLFSRLYRGEYARNTPGSGLGLTIAKKIIELHKGNIYIKSRRNTGNWIEFQIPFDH